MQFDIKPSEVKKETKNIAQIHRELAAAKKEIESVKRNLSSELKSYSGISGALALQASNVEALINKFASMEDGLEQAVAFYLKCERMISGGDINTVNGNVIDDIKEEADNFWEKMKNWFRYGVWTNSEKAERIAHDKAMAKELKNLLKTDKYNKKAWKNASVKERKKILTDLFNDMQAIYGVSIGTLSILSIETEPGYITYGWFSRYTDEVRINADLLEDDKYYDKIMETMAHEMRHAYQWEACNNPDKFQVDAETAKEWKDNFRDYKTTEDDGYDAYRNQPIERDAREFAAWVA